MKLIDEIIEKINTSKNNLEIILVSNPSDEILDTIGLTEKSTLGTLLKYTNGVLVKNKLLRLFGSGDSEWTDSIKEWNNFPQEKQIDNIPNGCLIIGYDILGGFFAINGGYFGKDLGKVYYFAPDNLLWENLNIGHSQFVDWCIDGDVDKFYESFAWNESEEIIKNVKRGNCISFYPFLWSVEGKDISKTKKKIVPLKEIWNSNMEMSQQMNV